MSKREKLDVAAETLECSITDADGTLYKWDGSNTTALTADEQAAVDSAWSTYETEWSAQEYSRNRVDAYPSLGDQLDMMYHDQVDGTTTWKDAIQAVKDANPKPTE